jgi:CheY-like chemotaxis protein
MGKVGYILIVNSDPTMRQTVSGYFSEHNLSTSCASNWSELKCTGTPPSLIIMDDQPLGPSDGLDRLRSIRSNPDIPITVTGHRPTQLIVSSASNLAPDYIAKPSPGNCPHVPALSCGEGDGARRANPRSGWRRLQVQWPAARAFWPKTRRPQCGTSLAE